MLYEGILPAANRKRGSRFDPRRDPRTKTTEQSVSAGDETLRQTRFILPKFGLKSLVFRPKPFPQILPKSYRHNAVPNHFSSRFSTSCTNGPRSLSRAKAGTHSPSPTGSHTAAHTPKQVVFWVGVVSLPSDRSERSRIFPGRVSERRTLPLLGLGRVYSRRTQRAFGTAMCLCASRPRWAA